MVAGAESADLRKGCLQHRFRRADDHAEEAAHAEALARTTTGVSGTPWLMHTQKPTAGETYLAWEDKHTLLQQQGLGEVVVVLECGELAIFNADL